MVPQPQKARESLLSLAKTHLGLASDASDALVPPAYLDELRVHMYTAGYEHDTNFIVIPHGGAGYGIVVCLQTGCDSATIPLEKSSTLPNGGKGIGIGSLASYRAHIDSHPYHSVNRQLGQIVDERKSATKVTKGQSVKREDTSVPPNNVPARSGLFTALMGAIKQERSESAIIPQKRLGDIALAGGNDHSSPAPSTKRFKQEAPPHSPLRVKDLNRPAAVAGPSNTRDEKPQVKGEGPLFKRDPDLMFTKTLNAQRNDFSGGNNISSKVNSFHKPAFSRRPLLPELSDESDDEMQGQVARVAARFANAIPYIPPVANADSFDDRGDFYGRGRDTFEGPVARVDDIEMFLKHAGNSEQFDENATVGGALAKLGLPHIQSLIPGLDVPLMPHQVIGVAWGVDKENGRLKGGVLGDDMGLGKTVQILGIMAKNKPTNPKCKTTLIIGPTALLDQWALEISLKTNDALSCVIYHGNTKPKSKSQLLKYDVVLTTFTTMALEWPDPEAEMKKREKRKSRGDDWLVSDSEDDSPRNKRNKKKDAGLLFQVEYYRIILDEAQMIRNKKTRASRAVTFLRSTYKWCLTGTPIVNGLADVYPYLRFLQMRPWYDFEEFHGYIGRLEKKNPALAVTRLQAILNEITMRRKKDSMLDGKRLIELPPKNVVLHKLEFSEEERDIYKAVETQSQAQFNRYLRAGTVLKNYAHVLVMLLRLRQICSHPCLIQEDGVAFVPIDEYMDDAAPEIRRERLRARDIMGPAFVSQMLTKFRDRAQNRLKAEKESVEASVDDEECPICFDHFNEPVVTACGHTYCQGCIIDVLSAPLPEGGNEGNGMKPGQHACPLCNGPLTKDKVFLRVAFEPTDEELGLNEDYEMSDATPKPKRTKGRKPQKKSNTKKSIALTSDDDYEEDASDDDDDMSDFIVESDEDEEEKDLRREAKRPLGRRNAFVILDSEDEMDVDEQEVVLGKKKKVDKHFGEIKLMSRFLPSTKMKWMMDHIKRLATEHSDEKVLVISQWTSCLSLVSDYLTENEIPHVKYQGDMNRLQRDQAVRVFMAKRKAKVMLMSLKCGGVGLNLTRANNVISLDLGWSQAIESQAFDRVHRLGQIRDVEVNRLVIEQTVEDRILALQDRKQNLADGSLGEGKAKKIGKLTVKDLANLFGLDARGRVL